MIEIITDPFPEDAALKALWQGAWNSDGPASFQPILSRSLVHAGAKDGATLIGFVNVAWDGGVHGFILDTCVLPAYRRQGIAVKLVQAVSEEARQRGVQWLHVDFEPHLESFYRQCGFGHTAAGLMRLG